jgi:hypothetical protein
MIAALGLALVALVGILWLRPRIAGTVLTDSQIDELQQNGLAGTWLNNPSRLIFEYRFVRRILQSSSIPSAPKLLRRWNLHFGALLIGAASFLVLVMVSILFPSA